MESPIDGRGEDFNLYKNNIKKPERFEENEIDLLELLVKLIWVIRKRIWWILILLIGSVLIGIIGRDFFHGKSYSSSFMGISNVLDSRQLVPFGNDISNYLQEENYSKVANLLTLSEKEAKEILRFSMSTVNSGDLEVEPFVVEVTVASNDILDNLQNGFIQYLSMKPFVKEAEDFEKKKVSSFITDIDVQINQLSNAQERLTEVLNEGIEGSGSTISIGDYASLSKEILALKSEKFDLQEKLEKSESSFTIIKSFQSFDNGKGKSLLYTLGISFALGLVLVFIVVGSLEMRSLIIQKEKELILRS